MTWPLLALSLAYIALGIHGSRSPKTDSASVTPLGEATNAEHDTSTTWETYR